MTEAYQESSAPRIVALVFGRHTDYVWGLRFLLLLSLILFLFSLSMGFYFGDRIPGDTLDDVLEAAFPELENMSPLTLFLFVFLSNVIKNFVWMVLGAFFSLPSLLFTAINGFIMGWLTYSVQQEHSLLLAVAGLVPHGVIEIPLLLLSSAAGMSLGYQMINRLRRRSGLKAEFLRAISLFIWRITPLLFITAVIEFTVTPIFMSMVI